MQNYFKVPFEEKPVHLLAIFAMSPGSYFRRARLALIDLNRKIVKSQKLLAELRFK